MTTLSQECISLELAKELHELYIHIPSLYYWVSEAFNWSSGNNLYPGGFNFKTGFIVGDEKCGIPAYTCSELGRMLPELIDSKGVPYWLECDKDTDGSWDISYSFGDDSIIYGSDLIEANSRAKALIELIKTNFITVEEINKNI